MGADTLPSAVGTEYGVFLNGLTEPAFICDESFEGSRWVLETADDGWIVTGTNGTYGSSSGGCHWRRTTGVLDGREVVGVYQPVTGEKDVYFAVSDDGLGPSVLAQTTDGGYTATAVGDFAVTGSDLVGLAGYGEELALVSVGQTTGTVRWWQSLDLGLTFEATELTDLPVTTDEETSSLAICALGEAGLFLWQQGSLFLVTRDGIPVETEGPPDGPWPCAMDTNGGLWVAAGMAGLWRRSTDADWSVVAEEETAHIQIHGSDILVARPVSHVGDPMVLLSTTGGDAWQSVFDAPGTWDYPDACQASVSQGCLENIQSTQAAIGMEPEGLGSPSGDLEESHKSGCALGGEASWRPWLLFLLSVCFWLRRGAQKELLLGPCLTIHPPGLDTSRVQPRS